MRVFFVSNSTCYYFTDELYGLLTAAGYSDVRLCLAYASRCSLEQHYSWLLEHKRGYEYRVVDENGITTTPDVSLEEALGREDWDVISFDNNARSFASANTEIALSVAEPHFGHLYRFIKERYPRARYCWHEVWGNEVGYSTAFKVTSKEQRSEVYGAKRGVMHRMMENYGIEGVPTGDAWEKVRDLPLFTTPLPQFPEVERFTLCSRILRGAFKDDFSHDGDIGGGQYLNACVWFEVLTGESCIGNTFRPRYALNGVDLSLTEEKISVLQAAAHAAVAELKGQ